MCLSKKHLNNVFLISFLLILIVLPVSAESDYYADITIDVDPSGFVTIEGITNYPDLLAKNTEVYTLKKQSYWLLNITKEEIFSDFVYVLTLPESSSVNYIKSSGSIRIEEDRGNLIINGFGENELFTIQVQYQIGKVTEESFKFDPIFISLIAVIIVLIAILIGMFVKNRKTTQVINKNGYDLKGLNQRQKQIIKLLIDKKKPLTQTDIHRELNIPKAAVSRNIRRLELKGLIEKEQIGMSNLIRLKKI
jgi:uncharacterized membrane protein